MIIVALFVVALVAAMSYSMMSRLMRDTREATLLTRYTQADYYAQGSILWAMDQLRNDWLKQKPNRVVDAIPIKSPMQTMNDYRIATVIDDMQARFNLNNLSSGSKTDTEIFLRLMRLLLPTLSKEQAEEIGKATLDWVSPQASNKALTKYYADLPVPYRPAHKLMLHASEFKLVKGVTPEIYTALKPYIVALPKVTKINIQTAEAPVIAALGQNISLATAKSIVAMRDEKPVTSNAAFYNLDVVKQQQFPTEGITILSDFFLAKTDVSIEKQSLVLYTLLERSAQNGQVKVFTHWQSKGVY